MITNLARLKDKDFSDRTNLEDVIVSFSISHSKAIAEEAADELSTLKNKNKELMYKLENGIELVKQGTYSSGALQLWAKTAKDLLAKVKQKGG